MAHQMPIVILLFIANSDFNLLSDIEKLLLQQEKQGSRCPLIRFLHDGSLNCYTEIPDDQLLLNISRESVHV